MGWRWNGGGTQTVTLSDGRLCVSVCFLVVMYVADVEHNLIIILLELGKHTTHHEHKRTRYVELKDPSVWAEGGGAGSGLGGGASGEEVSPRRIG